MLTQRLKKSVMESLEHRQFLSGGVEIAAAIPPRVRVAYVIPSNRTPQPKAVQNLQNIIPQLQNWYADQLDRYGLGRKSFLYETEIDGVTPRINVVNVTETDSYLRGDIWSRVITAASNAGVSTWTSGEVWLLIPEIHLEASDGSITGGTALGASFGSGLDAGVAMLGSNSLWVLAPNALLDNRMYSGMTVPEIGPYKLVQDVSYVWFEGSTISSLAASYSGAMLHEMSHAFGLPHDFRNDDNADGVLMGNGLRGFNGALYPDQYPNNDTVISYGQALGLATSRYFNGGAIAPETVAPSLSLTTPAGTIAPVNGQLRIPFTANDSSGLAAAWLTRNGDQVAEIPLSGKSVNTFIETPIYSTGAAQTFEVFVYDIYGNRRSVSRSYTPSATTNRAPEPFIDANRSTLSLGQTLMLSAGRSTDANQSSASLKVEWDLNNDRVYETMPSTVQTYSLVVRNAGTMVARARITDSAGAASISAPIPIRVLPKVSGTGSDDNIYIRRDPQNLQQIQVFRRIDPLGTPDFTIPVNSPSPVTITLGNGNDHLFLDFSSGAPVTTAGLVFDGGTLADQLTLIGSGENESISIKPNQLVVGSDIINFGAVEQLTIDTGAGNDSIAVDFSSVSPIPSGGLNVDAGGGTDSINFLNTGGPGRVIAASVSGSLNIIGGTLNFTTDASGLAVAISNDALVGFSTSQHLAALSLTDNAKALLTVAGDHVIRTATLTIGPTATLDLVDNDLILQSAAATRLADLATVAGLIQTGRNSGDWNGNGLISSRAAAEPDKLTGLAVTLNDKGDGTLLYATFDGEPVDANSILVKYTYNGDADLNGQIDADDYFQIDNGFAQNLTSYRNGDFDFNGSVDADDYFLIDRAFAGQAGVLAAHKPVAATGISKLARHLVRHHRSPRK